MPIGSGGRTMVDKADYDVLKEAGDELAQAVALLARNWAGDYAPGSHHDLVLAALNRYRSASPTPDAEEGNG